MRHAECDKLLDYNPFYLVLYVQVQFVNTEGTATAAPHPPPKQDSSYYQMVSNEVQHPAQQQHGNGTQLHQNKSQKRRSYQQSINYTYILCFRNTIVC